jgi:hypothetical protein
MDWASRPHRQSSNQPRSKGDNNHDDAIVIEDDDAVVIDDDVEESKDGASV